MGKKSLLRLGYLLMVAQGLLSVLAPKKAAKTANVGWMAGFENVDELEPRDWYVQLTKITGVGLLVAGVTGLLVTRDEEDETDPEPADFADAKQEYEPASDEDDDDDDGPVTVDITDE